MLARGVKMGRAGDEGISLFCYVNGRNVAKLVLVREGKRSTLEPNRGGEEHE
jgi:hypothetical protein